MLAHELDACYTRLCQTMTALGEAQAPLFLARFALLAMTHIDDPAAVQRLVDAAAEDLDPATRPPAEAAGPRTAMP